MSPTLIARNYAETLLALAERQGGGDVVEAYGRAMEEVAQLLEREPRIRAFLETPRVSPETKKAAIRTAFGGRVPEPLLRFLLVVTEKRRQRLLRQISGQYRRLVDEAHGRVRAEVTLAHEPDEKLRTEIAASLERRLGLTVLPSFSVDRSLLGGAVIRVGDQILDGSLRRRAAGLRRHLLQAAIPSGNGARKS